MLKNVDKHIHLKEDHFLKIASQLEPLSAVVSGRGSRDEHLSNPLNTVTLIRRLTTDWLALTNLIGKRSGLSKEYSKWAEQKKLGSAVRNLARVQTTYNLSTNHLAASVLEETPANSNLTGTDCYWMARHYYQQHHHRETVQWLDQAFTKHDNTVPRHWLLELAVLSHCFSGESEKSTSTLSLLLVDFPYHKPSKFLAQDWRFMINNDCQKTKSIMMKKKNKSFHLPPSMKEKYNRLCQGNGKTSPDLKCRYVHYHKRHLRLAPFRLEELQLDPPVVIFHNVINEDEIQEAKNLVLQKLERSKIVSANGTTFEYYARTSETAWIVRGDSNVMDKLNKRMEDMTNLDTQFAENHQISRYGLGGEYLFHIDYFGEVYEVYGGDRIATLMFYLSDVPRGGHTVFQKWELSLKPKKGSAVFWFNLKRDGNGDKSSSHAGCSVIKGTKWVLNKWFHQLNNDITRPCDVDRKQTHKYFYL